MHIFYNKGVLGIYVQVLVPLYPYQQQQQQQNSCDMKERKISLGSTTKGSPIKPPWRFISIGVLQSFFEVLIMQEENWSAWGKTRIETTITISHVH